MGGRGTRDHVGRAHADAQARAWFSVTERRLGLPARIASRAAGLVAVGALMTTGVAIAAFADDGSSSDKPACSASVTTDCVDKKADDKPATQEAKADDPPAAATEDKPAKSDDAPAAGDGGSDNSKSDDTATSDDSSKSDDTSKADDTSKGDDTSKTGASSDDSSKGSGSKDSGSNDATTGSSDDAANGSTSNDGGTSTSGSDNGATGSGSASNDQGSGSSGSGSGSSGGNASGGSDDPVTHDTGNGPASGGTDDTPTNTTPVTNPLPPAPAATSPATTTPPPATDDVSALAGLEVTADTTYFQLPSGASHGTSTAPSGNKGVTGGLTDSGGANDIHAVGISALALLQLQRASSLAPAPAPLPNIRELTPAQVTKLRQVARHTGVAWTVLAAVQRLGRHKGQSLTATGNFLRTHGARGGADSPFRAEHALAAYFGSKEKGERAAALAAYYWAVGSTGLTKGLAVASASLGDALLTSPAVSVYAGGRSDLQLHRVDPRVEMTIRYLQASFGTVSVSCLISGHSVFTTSGNVSAHIFGRAADIAAVGGTPILGHQGPQTVTERAVRLLLMLPKDVAPRQIISLMDLDGATGNTGSFALPDHANHIHIGY